MDKDSLQLLLARGMSVEEIGRRFDRHPSTVSYWLAKHGLTALKRDKHAAKGGISRDRLEEMVERGMSIAEMAQEVGLSKGTVRHWLGKYDLRTRNRRGPRPDPAAVEARRAGRLTVTRACPEHGDSEFVIDARGGYRCRRCRSAAVTKRRRKVKSILVTEAGGRCAMCGYERCHAALAFHHLDPSQKRRTVSAQGMGVGIDELRDEARKCVLLCHNCHAEIESGAAELPIQYAAPVDPETASPGSPIPG